jgi:hypothetical protein
MRRLLTCLTLMLMLGLASGCATKTIIIDASCVAFKPILPSRRDELTRGTVDQILAHNELWAARCSKPNPQGKPGV